MSTLRDRLAVAVTTLLCAAAAAPPALAATFTWSGGALIGSKWSNDNNWTTAAPPSNSSAALVFTGFNRLDAEADGAWDVLGITFNSAAGAFTLQGDDVGIGGGGGGIANNDNSAQRITNRITLNLKQTWTTTSTGTLSVSIDTNGRILTVSAAADASIDLTSTITDNGGLTVNGAGRVFLNGPANTYTGLTTVIAGILQLDKLATPPPPPETSRSATAPA